jgi:hypothetical protein
MKKNTNLLLALGLISFFYFQTPAQVEKTKEPQVEKTDVQKLFEETQYVSLLRYVIVYNDVVKLNAEERRIELILDEKQFSEENLIKVFNLVKQRFPLPVRLEIEVHTNLATIETPEERDKPDSSTGRLTHKTVFHKTAGYSRFNDGSEGMSYTVSLSPFSEKVVFLEDKSVSKPK